MDQINLQNYHRLEKAIVIKLKNKNDKFFFLKLN